MKLFKLLTVTIFLTLIVGCEPNIDRFHTVEYRGHTYVVYIGGGGYDSGVVHDPDCRCQRP